MIDFDSVVKSPWMFWVSIFTIRSVDGWDELAATIWLLPCSVDLLSWLGRVSHVDCDSKKSLL